MLDDARDRETGGARRGIRKQRSKTKAGRGALEREEAAKQIRRADEGGW